MPTMRKKLTKRSVEALKPAKVFYEVIDDETPGFMVRVAPSGPAIPHFSG